MCEFLPDFISEIDMATTFHVGNIFTSDCRVLVNTVNCVGVMGAGIALEFRLRYPEMYARYVQLCAEGRIDIGMLWVYRTPDRWVLNFPTKREWRAPSRLEYVVSGLHKFAQTYAERGIQSIAFPLLGADRGGLEPDLSLATMRSVLDPLEIDIEIYRHDPASLDDLYVQTRDWLFAHDLDYISAATGIGRQHVRRVMDAMNSGELCQLNQLAQVEGVGIRTLERIFRAAMLARDGDAAGATGQSLDLF